MPECVALAIYENVQGCYKTRGRVTNANFNRNLNLKALTLTVVRSPAGFCPMSNSSTVRF